ncbi:Cytochrome P450, E-class, group I [Parasponia andersonii]|uniref:Cytochrome P450, E-class, group I n=1 Tax=Parasponia andersonii TaxID=3476 RepID=A0A2P5E2I1_PARAD|nr:Cytochrome P450, E-class, group I [Parasponia andersonii]
MIMSEGRDLTALVLSFICLCLFLALIKIFHKLWWAPTRVKHLMGLQGVKGPSYRFIHGSTKQIMSMQKEAMARPLGLSNDIFPKLLPHVHCWTNLYGKNYLQWYGPQPQMVITEPELIREILSDRERVYPKNKAQMYLKKVFGDSVATSQGEKWAKMRKIANHAFQIENLKGMMPQMIASVEAMIERWKDHEDKEIDVYEEFRLLTAEVISRTAFGSSYLEGKTIFEMLAKLTIIVSRNLYEQRFPGISKFFKTRDQIESEKLEKGIHDSIMEMIKKREEKLMNGEEDSFGSDYLGILLKAHHDANVNQRITIDSLVSECKTLYFAGQETTNSLLAWTVFLLAAHTDWQEIARKEVLDVFGKQNPNPDGITKLKSMSLIINESLRLYPPANIMSRTVEREVRLGKLNLPASIILSIPTLALHHDPRIWGEDVHLFKPERFSEGVAKATKDNMAAFLPFGMGPRICVGFNFAITEAKIALSMILQRYTFTLSPAYVHSPVQILTNRPQHGLQVMLESF